MTPTTRPFSIRCLDISQSIRHKVIRTWEMLESALAMGLIKDETFTSFDAYPYDETKSIELAPESYELEGWIRGCTEANFEADSSVLVVAAGGLQELVALNQQGYSVDGVEFGQRLFEVSKQWLDQNLPNQTLQHAQRYEIPSANTKFEAAFVARHYYSHIRKSEERIDFLRSIRNQLKPGAPLILSYYICEERACDQQPTFTLQQKMANLIRRILGRGKSLVAVGDHMDPESALYHHHFTDEEVASELKEAGFETNTQDSTWFGWTAARAIDTSPVNFPALSIPVASSAISTAN